MRLAACVPLSLLLLLGTPEKVEGLRGAEHSPSVLMLDEVHERLSEMDNVPEKQSEKIHEHLEGLGRDEGNLPNAGDKEQPDRIKYS